MRITDTQASGLAHHLRVVAAHYTQNAESVALTRIAEQFQRQAAECLRWANALEEGYAETTHLPDKDA